MRLHYLGFVLVLLLFSVNTHAQQKVEDFAKTITTDDLEKHLTYLASEALAGRETGEPGQKAAADYIANFFKENGLPAKGDDGTYFQRFSYITEFFKDVNLKVNGEILSHLSDYYALPSKNTSFNLKTDEVLFLGYGIDDENYSDYKGKDVKGKVLLIKSGEPRKSDGVFHITGTIAPSTWTTDITRKLKTAKKHGVQAVIILTDNYRKELIHAKKENRERKRKMGWSENAGENYVCNFVVSPQTLEKITGKKHGKILKALAKIDKKGKPKSCVIKSQIKLMQDKFERSLIGENVIGYLEGSDPKLKKEIIFVTAHYDHLGWHNEEIYFGADDNASGTSLVLDLCEAFVQAKKAGVAPRRTIVFMPVSGEEKGLLGSKYYVENPVFPLENTIADVNIDMVGRVDPAHKGNPNYIYVIGADRLSSELHNIGEQANQNVGLELDYTFNAADDPNRYYYRSDHYNFAEKGIPSVFYFSGVHEDYHRPTDTMDKINYPKIQRTGELIYHLLAELANRDERIKVDKQ